MYSIQLCIPFIYVFYLSMYSIHILFYSTMYSFQLCITFNFKIFIPLGDFILKSFSFLPSRFGDRDRNIIFLYGALDPFKKIHFELNFLSINFDKYLYIKGVHENIIIIGDRHASSETHRRPTCLTGD